MMFAGAPFGMPPQGWHPSMGPPPGMGPANSGRRIPLAAAAAAATQHERRRTEPRKPYGRTDASTGTDAGAFGNQAPFNGGMGPGGRGGAMSGRGRGRGGGPPGTFQSSRRSNTTLVIENVPADSLDLIKVNEYFKNVRHHHQTSASISPDPRTLVSYSQPSEATKRHTRVPMSSLATASSRCTSNVWTKPLEHLLLEAHRRHDHLPRAGATPRKQLCPRQNV